MKADHQKITEFLKSAEARTLFESDFNQRAAILSFAIGGMPSLPGIARKLAMTEVALIRRARHYQNKSNSLIEWLGDPRAEIFFGHSFAVRLQVLGSLVSRQETLTTIARRHKISRQAIGRYAREARRAFGL